MKLPLLALVVGSFMVFCAGCNKPAEPASGTTPDAGKTDAGQTATAKPKAVIGVSLLTMANPFFKIMGDAMKAEGTKNNYDVIVEAGEMDPARQRDQVNDFIVKKVNAIILSPCDSRSIGTSIQEANKAGIPVFTADIASLDKAAKVVSHIATDNYEGGKLAGKAMIDALGGKGKIAIIDHPEVESGIQRTKGFKEVIATAKGIQIVAQLPGGGQRDTSFKTAQDILEKNPQLDGIFAINDPSALGAVAAIEKAGRASKIKVIGFDGATEVKQAIKEGKVYADAIQFPDKIGTLAIQAIGKYMAGEQVSPQTLIPTALYTKADADKDTDLK
jgi:ribose transport system substrate-binding protein